MSGAIDYSDERETQPERYLEKSAKLRLAQRAIVTADIARLAKDQRERNRRVEDEIMGADRPTSADEEMLIVGDNVTIGAKPPRPSNGWGKVLAAAAIGAGLLGTGAGGAWLAAQYAKPQTVNETRTETRGLMIEGIP